MRADPIVALAEMAGIAASVRDLRVMAEGVGVSVHAYVCDVPRVVFDLLPGEAKHFDAVEGVHREFWTKTSGEVDFFTHEAPELTPAAALTASGVA